MELNINYPAYIKTQFGIDDDVYNFLKQTRLFFADKEYSGTLHTIGFILAAAPQEMYDSGAWKESVQLVSKGACAIICLRLNYEEYCEADTCGKIRIIKNSVLGSIKKIKSRVKFDYDSFERDFNLMFAEASGE